MTKISRRTFLKQTALGAGALGLMFTGLRMGRVAGAETFRLRIIHTNDHHARIEPEQVQRIGGQPPVNRNFGGVSRRKTLIDQIRAEGGNQLLLDAGDIFQGTLYFTRYEGIADLAFYREMGYDAITLGNHEFNLGPAKLATFIDGARNGGMITVGGFDITLSGNDIPVVSANINLTPASPLVGKIEPRIIKTLNGEQVGIFGLTTPSTAFLSSPGPTVTFTNPIDAAKAQVTALQADGVNKIIALAHLGYQEELELAEEVPEIDIVVGGHSHTPLRPQGDTRPLGVMAAGPYPTLVERTGGSPALVVTAWEWGKWLGDISIGFDAAGNVIPDGIIVRLLPVWADGLGSPARALLPEEGAEIATYAPFETLIETFAEPINQLRNTQVGTTAVDLDGERANVRSRETNLGNLIATAKRNKVLDILEGTGNTLPVVAIMNGGGIRASIPAGNVTVGNILTVLPFGNTIVYFTLTGAQLKEALENGVSRVGQSDDGRFPQIAGMRFTWNPNAAPGSRIISLEIETTAGAATRLANTTYTPYDPTADYIVATNNFLLTGGDNYTVFRDQARNAVDTFFPLADIVADYIRDNPNVQFAVEGRIQRLPFSLRIIHTNDHHARIEPELVQRIGGQPPVNRNFGGVSRRKTLIDQIRAEGGNQLLLDAGDIFQGTLYFTQYEGLADLAFYREMGYDAITLGNHEFNLGPAKLATFIDAAQQGGTINVDGQNIPLAGTDIDVISANIVVTEGSPLAGKIAPFVIKSFADQKVGIFGLTTPSTAFLSSPGPTVTFADPIQSAQAQVAALQAEGVNKIIALVHLGYQDELELAEKVPGIDIVVGGHSHTPLRPEGDTRPLGIAPEGPYPTVVEREDGSKALVVTDWEWGKWLGDFSVEFDDNGNINPDSLQVRLWPVWASIPGDARDLLPQEGAEIEPYAPFEAQIATFVAPIDTLRNTPVGTTAVELDGARNNVRSRETNLGNLIATAKRNKVLDILEGTGNTLPVVAIMNGGGIRATIPAGNVTLGDVLTVLPFGNTIVYFTLTGAQLKEALENGVSRVGQSDDGRFPQIAGMRFTWNPNAAPGSRIISLEIETTTVAAVQLANTTYTPYDPTADYIVATNNFLLTGGDNYTVFRDQARNAVDTFFPLADIVADYIRDNPNVQFAVEGRIIRLYRVHLPLIQRSAA